MILSYKFRSQINIATIHIVIS
uniref:Uncharacterized protein n=1 Tax=Anguilla anguilla TaxID=7936 RepID=A0A0E9VZ33_ANGAN